MGINCHILETFFGWLACFNALLLSLAHLVLGMLGSVGHIAGAMLRSLHYFWMTCLRSNRQTPGIYEALRRSESIVWQSMQCISQIMFSNGTGRLLFFWRSFSYATWDDFCAERPDCIRTMRRAFLSTSGWIYRRHWRYLLEPPLGIIALSDEKADAYVVAIVCARWEHSNACCVKVGLSRDWKQRDLTIASFRSQPPHGCN